MKEQTEKKSDAYSSWIKDQVDRMDSCWRNAAGRLSTVVHRFNVKTQMRVFLVAMVAFGLVCLSIMLRPVSDVSMNKYPMDSIHKHVHVSRDTAARQSPWEYFERLDSMAHRHRKIIDPIFGK